MPVKEKVKRDARDYLAWAGFFVDPKDDADIFTTLPGWRQREALYVREQKKLGRTPSFEEIRRVVDGDPTDKLRVSLPYGLTLKSLRSRTTGIAPDGRLLEVLRPMVTRNTLMEHCTANGEGKRLLTEKPAHGLYAYVWALTLVRRKALEALPLPFFWELEEGIHQMTGELTTTRVKEAWPVLGWLDTQVATLISSVA